MVQMETRNINHIQRDLDDSSPDITGKIFSMHNLNKITQVFSHQHNICL